jgi:hypothetical protein
MSRSGYTDDGDGLEIGRWRQAVRRSIEGKRGQALLREMAEALDAMPEKELYASNFATPDGEFCALGVLGAKRGTVMTDLGDADECEAEEVARRFGIAHAMAAEIMYMNDEYFDEYEWVEIVGPPRNAWHRHPQIRQHKSQASAKRWQHMRKWVAEQIKEPSA